MTKTTAGLIVRRDEPLAGAVNMSVDAELLEQAVAEGVSTLRFYSWAEPTISLGYFQKDVTAVPDALSELPVVKRLSGGGAILHHHELTYSLALAKDHLAAGDPTRLYELVHTAIINVLRTGNLESSLRGAAEADPHNKSFLCFSRSDANDIVVGSHKIVGSAQRRRKGAVLQHGSIVLRESKFAPQFPGVLDLGFELGKPADFDLITWFMNSLEKSIPPYLVV